VGISIPVTVLLGLSRGLTLADLGVVFLAHSLLVAVLELPTGSLADLVGRRPVLVASGLLHLLSSLAYATAEGLLGFLGAAGLLAAGQGRRPGRGGPVDTVLVATTRTGCVGSLQWRQGCDGGEHARPVRARLVAHQARFPACGWRRVPSGPVLQRVVVLPALVGPR